jgi:hypothetical protein
MWSGHPFNQEQTQMGYSYCARSGRLACDACGDTSGTTRKRTCPHKVHYADGGSLPYCYPSALCRDCYAKHKATLHDDCKAGADARNQQEQRRAARLVAGDYEVKNAYGSWHKTVPDGMVGVRFVNRAGAEVYRLVPDAIYNGESRGNWLQDYPDAQPWDGGATA